MDGTDLPGAHPLDRQTVIGSRGEHGRLEITATTATVDEVVVRLTTAHGRPEVTGQRWTWRWEDESGRRHVTDVGPPDAVLGFPFDRAAVPPDARAVVVCSSLTQPTGSPPSLVDALVAVASPTTAPAPPPARTAMSVSDPPRRRWWSRR